MIRKRTGVMILGILLVLGACSPSTDEGPDLTSPPDAESPDKESGNPEMGNDIDPERTAQTYEEIQKEVKSAIQTDVDVKLPEEV